MFVPIIWQLCAVGQITPKSKVGHYVHRLQQFVNWMAICQLNANLSSVRHDFVCRNHELCKNLYSESPSCKGRELVRIICLVFCKINFNFIRTCNLLPCEQMMIISGVVSWQINGRKLIMNVGDTIRMCISTLTDQLSNIVRQRFMWAFIAEIIFYAEFKGYFFTVVARSK